MAKKIETSENSIRDILTEDWGNDDRNGLPYSGEAVRVGLQGKLTELQDRIDSATDGVKYSSRLTTELENGKTYVTASDTFEVKLRYSSIMTDSDGKQNANIDGQLYIQTKDSNADKYGTPKAVQTLKSKNESSVDWDFVDIGAYLNDGTQDVRLYTMYNVLDNEGEVAQMVQSGNIVFVAVKTQLGITYAGSVNESWNAVAGRVSLDYNLQGEVARTLHVKVTGSKGNDTFTFNIGANEYTTKLSTYKGYVNIGNDTLGLATHGVKTMEAWLTCSDGFGGTIESKHIINQRMVMVDEDENAYLLVQNLAQDVVNYVQTVICSYSFFSRKAQDKSIAFILTDYDGTHEYFRIENVVEMNKTYTLVTAVEIEEEGNPLYAYLTAQDSEGTTILNRKTIKVDNTENFAPTQGADFVLNPKVRNNSEQNPLRIVNAANGQEVESTWEGFSALTDAWMNDADNHRVLRVLAGQRLTINYDWLAAFANNNTADVTFELDYKVSNVTDEDSIILNASENYGGRFLGMQMKPMEMALYTKAYSAHQEQNLLMGEDRRTHIAINIVSALRATEDSTPGPLCRVFLNGVIVREFPFNTKAADWRNNGTQLVIGQDHADIDIYGMRIYKTALSSGDILNDYVATLPTSEQKLAFREANKILNTATQKIDLSLCMRYKKNSLVWHGEEPYQFDNNKKSGWWEIHIYDEDGNEDLDHSGTICKDSKSLQMSGQGTTAMTYYDFNGQTKLKDVKSTIRVKKTAMHSSLIVVGDPYEDGGKTMVKIYGGGLGKKDNAPTESVRQGGAQAYEVDGDSYIVPDGWVDGNGKYRGKVYKLSDKTPNGQKLVNKINYASSMQSHLMGANNAYNDLHTAIVGRIGMQADNSTARICKEQKQFLYFSEQGGGGIQFRGMSTFGPGKMDDGTMGYDKSSHPNFCMLEGSDNNLTLTDFRAPWESNHIIYDYDADKNETTGFKYDTGETDEAGHAKYATSFDVDKYADSDSVTAEIDGHTITRPNDFVLGKIKQFVNFVYLHSPRIGVFVGRWEQFLTSASAQETTKKWWCTAGDNANKLMRWSDNDKTWVNAGWNATTEQTEVINVATTYANAFSQHEGDWDAINKAIIRAIAQDAREHADEILFSESLKFHYCFVNSFLGGTDNCSKNTYYILVKDQGGNWRWAFSQDDMDTIFATDNSGYQNKPYYITRQFPSDDNEPEVPLYQGTANALFDLEEAMYEENGENRRMMNSIFAKMTELSGSPWKFMDDYFFSIQKYFPAVAYNEQARVRYEFASQVSIPSDGGAPKIGYVSTRQVRPITQSIGDQLEAEMQFMKRRLIMFASYAAYGDFGKYTGYKGGSLGIADAQTELGIPGKDGATQTVVFTDLVTHQYLYPCGYIGGSNIPSGMRCKPGEKYTFSLGSVTGETACSLLGANYFRSFGNLGDFSINPVRTFEISGRRLQDITIIPSEGNTSFAPAQLAVSAPYIETFTCNAPVGGTLNLENCVRLKSVDTEGSLFTEIELPKSRLLTSVKLGAKMVHLSIKDIPNLTTLTLGGFEDLESVLVKGVATFDSKKFTTDAFNADAQNITSVEFDNIDWQNVTLNFLRWVMGIENSQLRGKISLVQSDNYTLTLDDKVALGRQYGNIDNPMNTLYVEYDIKEIESISIKCDDYIRKTGLYEGASLSVMPKNGNSVKITEDGELLLAWSLSDGAYEYAEIADALKGTINVKKLSEPEDRLKFDLTCEATTIEERSNVTIIGYENLGELNNGDGNDIYYNRFDVDLNGKTIYGINIYTNKNSAVNVYKVQYESYGGRFLSTEQIQTFTADKSGVNTFIFDNPVTLGENEVVAFKCPNGGAYFGWPSGYSYAKENTSWNNRQSAYNLIDYVENTSKISTSVKVGFYDRIPEVGDFAYGDGTFSDIYTYHTGKDFIGNVFMREKVSGGYLLRIVSPEELKNAVKGLKTANNVREGITTEQASEISIAIGETVYPVAGIFEPTDSTYSFGKDLPRDNSKSDGWECGPGGTKYGTFDGKDATQRRYNVARKVYTYFSESFPKDLIELEVLKTKYNTDEYPQKYQRLYTGPVSAKLYEPEFQFPHRSEFEKGNWYMVSYGELKRLCVFCINGFTNGLNVSNNNNVGSRGTWRYTKEQTIDFDYGGKEANLPLFAIATYVKLVAEGKSPTQNSERDVYKFGCGVSSDGKNTIQNYGTYNYYENYGQNETLGVSSAYCCQFLYETEE